MKFRFLVISFFGLIGLSACDEAKVVDLGPKADARIKSGESANSSLALQKNIKVQEQKLENQLNKWIHAATKAADNPPGYTIDIHRTDSSCIASIRNELVNEKIFSRALQDLLQMKSSCTEIIILARRLHIPPGQTLSSGGLPLSIFADVIDLEGTISTDAPPTKSNENGKDAGDLQIYTLSLRSGPEGKISTRGSDAGIFDYTPHDISPEKIAALRHTARKTGIRYSTKNGTRKSISVPGPTPDPLAEAYLEVENKAAGYITKHHPSYEGPAPNPFSGKRKSIRAGNQVFWWKLYSQRVDASPLIKKDFQIEVPGLKTPFERHGGNAGVIKLFIASPLSIPTPEFDATDGSDNFVKLDQESAWNTSVLDDAILVSHQNQIRYSFELWQRPAHSYNSKDFKLAKSWESTVPSKDGKKSSFHPRIKVYPSGTPDAEEKPQTAEATPRFILEFGKIQFIDEALEKTFLAVSDLPPGLAHYRDWAKEWLKLESSAQREGISLRQ